MDVNDKGCNTEFLSSGQKLYIYNMLCVGVSEIYFFLKENVLMRIKSL